MSIDTPFRDWQISSLISAGVGWNILSAGVAMYTLEAQDNTRTAPPVTGEIRSYDIEQPTNTRTISRQAVPESPSSEIAYHQPRLQGLSFPRLIRSFSVSSLSGGAGLDLTDLAGIPSGNISFPGLPSSGPDPVVLFPLRASATDLTGFACIMEIGASLVMGFSVQLIFLGTSPIMGVRGASDGVSLDRASLNGQTSSFESLITFLISMLAPKGVALMAGMNIGIGDFGIALQGAYLRVSEVGSTVCTVDVRDI
ncbi:MAG: hypothetical protein GY860_27770 [Desulfobacteraceae bacterium]|nr:hypothetical protein [Desulfobacteraceae bacterium]